MSGASRSPRDGASATGFLADRDLTVTVKRVAGGLISNWFNDHVAEGDVLEVYHRERAN